MSAALIVAACRLRLRAAAGISSAVAAIHGASWREGVLHTDAKDSRMADYHLFSVLNSLVRPSVLFTGYLSYGYGCEGTRIVTRPTGALPSCGWPPKRFSKQLHCRAMPRTE
jgi:hypothetical protein